MIQISDKAIFDHYLCKGERPLSCYHFSAVFAWQDHFRFSFEVVRNRLCVFAHQDKDCFLYVPPLGGALDTSTLEECFRMMKGSRIARIENISDNQLKDIPKDLYNTYLKAHEYIYRRKDLEELAGHAYKPKRHDIHHFTQHHPACVYRAFVPEDLPACQTLYRRWMEDRRAHHTDAVYVSMLEENVQVHALLMAHAKELGLIGRVVVIDGQVAGYAFGYPLDGTTFCVMLEITDLQKTGLAAFIFNRFCCDDDVKRFERINAMDDFGMPNVALTKRSWRPIEEVPIYTISLKVSPGRM